MPRRRKARSEPLVRRYGFDALIVLLAIEAMVEIALRRHVPDAPRTALWFSVPAIAVLVLPLFARHRFPFAAPSVFWLLAVGMSVVDGQLVTFLSSVFAIGMAASFLLGNQRAVLRAQTGLAVTVGGAAIVVYDKAAHSFGELVFIPLLFGICWLAGFAVRERAEQAQVAEVRATQAERDAAARIAVAEERARIARELHDIVAHAVSVMVLQVGAVRHKLPDSLAEDRDALTSVEQAGRTALAEMRRLLAAMRSDEDDIDLMPQPGLDALGSLAEEIGRAGLPVRLHVDGEPFPLPAAIDLSAYRIVQEGLTNALKHARASHADVTVCYGPDDLRTEVRDNGIGAAAGDGPGTGHGLVGIRERVKIYGGEMTAETASEGGFVLSARLQAARFKPTVILMDIRMPELDGLQATRRIIAADDTARVLILTTFDFDQYVYEALRAGASGFLLKDDPPEQLLAAIRAVAGGDALLSPAVTKRVIRQFARIRQAAPPREVNELTERELDVFRLIARGYSNAEISRELYISDTTVKTHITHILQKLSLRDRVQAVVLAYETGLFDADAPPPGHPRERPAR